jgi:hypothetical protein
MNNNILIVMFFISCKNFQKTFSKYSYIFLLSQNITYIKLCFDIIFVYPLHSHYYLVVDGIYPP